MSIAGMTAPYTTLPPSTTLSTQEPQPATKSRAIWVFVAFLLPFAALAARHWSWDPPTGSGDYAQYLAHARAVVEGRPYTDIGYIYHPRATMVGPRAYPPGLPLTLAPIVAVAGVNTPLIRVLMLVTALAFGYLVYRRLQLDIAPWQAAAAAGISVFVIESRFGTLAPHSDVGLCALMWACVLAVDSARSWTWGRIVLVTALGFSAMTYRVAGIALIPALGLYALLTWSRHSGRALYPALIWSGAGLTAVLSTTIELPFATMLVPRIAELSNRMGQVFSIYSRGALAAQLYPFQGNLPNDIYHALASVFMLAGVAALLWRLRRTMLAAMTVMYLALLMASPAITGRYLWPLIPVLTAGFVLGVSAAWRAIAERVRWPAGAPLVGLATFAFILIAALSRELRVPPLPSEQRDPALQALYGWLREARQREPVRVQYSNPRVLTLETRVPAMPALFAKPDHHLASLYDRDITHVIWPIATPRECRARLAHDLPVLYPDHFTLEYENAAYRVYRVVSPPKPIRQMQDYQPSWGGHRCNPSRPDLDPDRS